jgi:hypothetical protein
VFLKVCEGDAREVIHGRGEQARRACCRAVLRLNLNRRRLCGHSAGIRGFPTFHFFRGGAKVKEMVGATPDTIRSAVVELKPKVCVCARAPALSHRVRRIDRVLLWGASPGLRRCRVAARTVVRRLWRDAG